MVISATRQPDRLPAGIRWNYYTTFASPLKGAIAFDLRDMAGVSEHMRQHGYYRVRVQRTVSQAGGLPGRPPLRRPWQLPGEITGWIAISMKNDWKRVFAFEQ